jgi:hypothetical protein
MTAPKYELRTIKDIFDLVPADRIKDCCEELGSLLAQAKYQVQLVEAASEALGAPLPEGAFAFPDSVEWIDDGKQEITTRMVEQNGKDLLSITSRPDE